MCFKGVNVMIVGRWCDVFMNIGCFVWVFIFFMQWNYVGMQNSIKSKRISISENLIKFDRLIIKMIEIV